MDVAIIGAGSIGMLLGSYLAESGFSVTMLVRKEHQCDVLLKKGIGRLNEDGTETVVPVHATTAYEDITAAKLIVVAVKYKDVDDVLSRLKEHNLTAPLLFIQNGLGHLIKVTERDFPTTAFATVEHGALKQGHEVVKHNGVGAMTIGVAFGEVEEFQLIERAHTKQFPIYWHDDATHILVRKALINCLINPLTTILTIRNGDLVNCLHSNSLMKKLYEELLDAFPEMATDLSFEDVEMICENTARNESSMLTDYRNGRPMEIDTIVSATIERAASRGKLLPLLRTYEQLLYVLDRKATEQ